MFMSAVIHWGVWPSGPQLVPSLPSLFACVLQVANRWFTFIGFQTTTLQSQLENMDVSENSGTPKSSILIGFSIIFTIHFGVALFLEFHPYGTWEEETPQRKLGKLAFFTPTGKTCLELPAPLPGKQWKSACVQFNL